MNTVIHKATTVKKKLKYFNSKVRRLKLKVKSLKEIFTDLRKRHDCEDVLISTFSGLSLEVIKRIMNQRTAIPMRAAYHDELK